MIQLKEDRKSIDQKEHKGVGFALGGLAGNNAHGAGFLAAALKRKVEPVAISCTSGQIHWVYEYLRARQSGEPEITFSEKVNNIVRQCNPSGQKDSDLWNMAFVGIPDVMRLSQAEWIGDLWFNIFHEIFHLTEQTFLGIFDGSKKPFFIEAFWNIWPARTMVSLRDESFFKDVAQTFNDEPSIEIYFNAYNFKKGKEIVYYNGAARDKCQKSSKRYWIEYQPVDETAVRNALQLYEYGFKGADFNYRIDGAYIRNIMLTELADEANIIYVARPMPNNRSHCPSSYIEREDLKTEVNFNGIYALERQRIEMVNEMINDMKEAIGKHPEIHPVKVKEIPFKLERGYFDYVFESADVFERARRDTAQFCIDCTLDCQPAKMTLQCPAI